MKPLRNVPILATMAVCILLYAAAAVHYPSFFTVRVFVNFLVDNSFLGIIAVGMTLVIISGGIDLSVGAVLALCSVLMAILMGRLHVSPVIAMAAALAVGTTMGLIMGCIIHFLKLAPFIVTLAGMFFARGLAQIISMQSIPIENPFYQKASELALPLGPVQMPVTAVVFLITVLAGIYITTYTSFGRNLYAVGGNENAALLMGLPIGRTKLLVYTFSGFCSALAAIIFTIYQSAGNPTAGVGMELDAIAVVVIGGTLLSGGAGYVFGTLIGILIFGIIQTGIMFQGNLNSWWTKVAIGVLLLFFIVLQRSLGRKKEGWGDGAS